MEKPALSGRGNICFLYSVRRLWLGSGLCPLCCLEWDHRAAEGLCLQLDLLHPQNPQPSNPHWARMRLRPFLQTLRATVLLFNTPDTPSLLVASLP